ncbi:hypothetical protein [Paenibacillus oleatilyticus]|uniref:Uncharacterized protein n=1 Tax=Paenibacillus oleatilyticus TaxID=2594886 RepID=A0ABV4VB79_9BACL
MKNVQTLFSTPTVFIKLKGYANGNNPSSKNAYNMAKQPIESGWNSAGFKGNTIEEAETWIKQNGWIGLDHCQ